MRGRFGPRATARNGVAFSSGSVCIVRSAAVIVAFTPGVPDSCSPAHQSASVWCRAIPPRERLQVRRCEKVSREARAKDARRRNRRDQSREFPPCRGAGIAIEDGSGSNSARRRHNDVEAVGSAALKQHDQLLFVRHGGGGTARCKNDGSVLRPSIASRYFNEDSPIDCHGPAPSAMTSRATNIS